MKNTIIKKENAGKIEEVLKILEKKSLQDSWFASRYIFNLWYIILEPEFDYLKDNAKNKALYQKKLKDLSAMLLDLYFQDAFYNFILGYLMTISDWYFVQTSKVTSLDLLQKAHKIEPDNALFHYYFKLSLKQEDKNLKKDICDNFDKIFRKDKGIMEKYFFEILCKK